MKNILTSIYILLLSILLFSKAVAQEAPSTEEIIESLRSSQSVSFSMLPMIHAYTDLCLPRNEITNNLTDICEAVIASPICQNVEEDKKMNCQTMTERRSLFGSAVNIWHFLRGCSEGVFSSVQALLGFIWDQTKSIVGHISSSEVRAETYQQASEYLEGVNLYLHTEYSKAYQEASLPFRETNALMRMSMSISKQLLSRVMELISQKYQEIGCLNFEAKSKTVCQFIGEIFIPPVGGFVLLKHGIKASGRFSNIAKAFDKLDDVTQQARGSHNRRRLNEARHVLERDLTPQQRRAVIEAHEVGQNEPGKDGSPARIGNYTQAQLRQKARILKNQGFNQREIRTLMENGIVGLSAAEMPGFIGMVRNLFRRNPYSPPPELPPVAPRTPPVVNRALAPNTPFEQQRQRYENYASYFDPTPSNRPRYRRDVTPTIGQVVAVPRSRARGGGLTNGTIQEILPDGRVRVELLNMGDDPMEITIIGHKDIHPHLLQSPLNLDVQSIKINDEVSIHRSNGERSNVNIVSIDNDRASVTWTSASGRQYMKSVDIQDLGRPINNGYDVARQRGLLPTESIRVRGADDVKVGKFFQDPDGRLFTVAKVTVNGVSNHHIFYRSKSQSVFRLLPAVNKSGLRPGYDKGIDENALTLPHEIQAALSERARSLDRSQIDEMKPIELDGIVRVNHSFKDHLNQGKVGEDFRRDTIINPGVERKIADSVNRFFANPRDVRIQVEANRPNYSRSTSSYKLNSPVYGDVTAYVYPSRNGQLEYTLLKDESNRIWFADVGYRGSSLSSHGLREDAINAEELTMPLWEYSKQIPDGYNNRKNERRERDYVSSWSYIREMPEIQRWYRENNMPIPE